MASNKLNWIKAAALLMVMVFGISACGGAESGSAKGGDSSALSKEKQTDISGETDKSAKQADEMDAMYSDFDLSFNTYSEAGFSEDGETAYIPLGNGDCVEIHEDDGINFAAITPNREHIVVLEKNHELYITDIRQKGKKVLSSRCTSSRVYPSNEGLGFQEGDGDEKHMILYSFEDETLTDMGVFDDGLISDNRTAAAAIKDDSLYLHADGFKEVRSFSRIGSGKPDLIGISDDGSTVVWTEETTQYQTKILYTIGEDETAQTIGDIQVRGFVYATFSTDGKLALITSDAVNRLYLKNTSGQWVSVELPGEWKNETGVYETDAGLLHEVSAEEIHYIYLRCGSQLCAVSTDGALTVLQDSVRDFDIAGGTLYYSDSQLNIYAAGLDGASVSENTLILSGLDTFAVAPDGQYLYGLTVHNDDEKVRSLSVYPLHGENAEVVVLSESIYADAHVYLSSEESKVFYIDDMTETEDDYHYIGTLKVYDAESGETQTINTDVFKNTFINGKTYVLVSEYAQSVAGVGKFVAFHGNLAYRKMAESETSGDRFDWYYYDGKESVLMASGLSN